jgi:hypothetical protein
MIYRAFSHVSKTFATAADVNHLQRNVSNNKSAHRASNPTHLLICPFLKIGRHFWVLLTSTRRKPLRQFLIVIRHAPPLDILFIRRDPNPPQILIALQKISD